MAYVEASLMYLVPNTLIL